MKEDIKYLKDEIGIDAKANLKSKRSKKILDSLDEFDQSQPVTLISSLGEKNEEKKKKKKDKNNTDPTDDEDLSSWFDSLKFVTSPKSKKKSKSLFDFDEYTKGKKGKKQKNSDGKNKINHKKEFEPEMALLRNLQLSQSDFVASLQRKYDQMENTKSTARGIGKFTTDLIDSINGARSLSLQIADKIISTKKAIADLDFKERKEFGNNDSEQKNLNNYASTFLKQIVTTGRGNVVNQEQSYQNFETIDDSEDGTDDLFDSITESLGDNGRSEEAEKYLQYENDHVELTVIWHDEAPDDNLDLKYEFVAHDQNGNVVDDYPLPQKTKMNINTSTSTATDIYGNKYKLIMD